MALIRTVADKKPPTNNAKVLRINNLNGGQKSAILPTLLASNEAESATNVSFSMRGAIQVRSVFKNRYVAPAPATNGVTGLGSLLKTDKTSRLLVGADEKLYYDTPYAIVKKDSQAELSQGMTLRDTSTSVEAGFVTVTTPLTAPNINVAISSKADLDAGTYDGTEYSVERFGAVLQTPPEYTNEVTLSADFTGDITNLDIVNDTLVLHNSQTFEQYASMTFAQLIAL